MATPTLRLQLQPLHRTEAVGALNNHGDISKCTSDGSPTDTYDPWDPPRPPPHPSIKALTSRHQFNMQRTIAMFCEIHDCLVAILKEDSVPSFQRMFVKYRERMVCGYVITPETLSLVIATNALRCAKFVLEGTAPKLGGQRANPNYITSYGFFPLHQAAETFSADMVELLLNYGALPNLRTLGDRIIEGLLPLHVAIENTCQHKYLEDNVLSDQSHMKGNVEYIYKLIYLLCLPKMASHEEVLGKVSAILQNYDAGPSGKVICIEDLDCCPYACPVPDGVLHEHGETDLSKEAIGSSTPEVKGRNAAIKEPRKGQNLYFARDQFLPIWRPVLTCRFLVSIFPSYAPKKESLYARPVDTKKKVNNQRPCQVGLGLLDTSRSWKSRKDPKVSSAPRSRRLFATVASTVLKMLKRS